MKLSWSQNMIQHDHGNWSAFQAMKWSVTGILAAVSLLFILSLPEKYFMTLGLGLIAAPVLFLTRNKEKMLVGAFLLSLPLTMGFMLMEQLETTNSAAEFVFQLYLCDVFLLFLVVIWLFKVFWAKHNSEHAIWQAKLTIPLVLWIGMGFVSLIPAIDRLAAAVGIIRMGRMFLIFLVVFHYIKGRKEIHFILKCLLVTLLFQALLMFAQYATNSLVFNLPGVHQYFDIVSAGMRPAGTMGHSSHYAKLSGLILPTALAYIFFAPTLRYKLFMLSIWGCGSVALGLTVSRMGVATWLLSMVLFLAGLFVLRIVSIRRMAPLFTVGIIWICISIGILYPTAGQQLEDRMKDDEGSAAVRIPMFKVAFNVIKAYPITGVGLKNYTLVHQDYDHTREHISAELPEQPVHNLFLLYAAEIGIPGLLFFLWFVWELLRGTLRCARSISLPMDKAIYLSIVIGVMNILLQSMTGWGVRSHLIHLSVIAIFAACVAKQCSILNFYREKA